MKSSYKKLKFSILLQSLLVTSLTVFVSLAFLDYVVNGLFNRSFADRFVRILMTFDVNETVAKELYWKVIGENREFFLLIGFLILFAIFFYISLTQMTKYLDQVEKGIENVIVDSTDPIRLTTELKPIELKLNEIKATIKRQELESVQAEKRKSDLVLFLAHDLKTPLTSVLAYLSILEEHPDLSKEERIKYTQIATDKAQRLEVLINEFFDITKFNLEEIKLEPVEINISLMLEQLADELYGVLQEKNLKCEVDVEDNMVVQADPDKMARVFDNILRNAIAYCYENSTILITAKRKKGNIEIVFSNEGKRIPGDMLQTIFEKFYRVDEARSSGTGGAGLGLAIAKKIVLLHGGKIIAKSDDFRTQFIVTLPENQKEKEE
ncbi:MAG TPA: HAMP domain-containing histidine kinase [Candidatus Dorea intestinavium]|nr:HAMP domain-containing histidine kinase [Candidatus Dorea intestinavium]